MKFGLGGGLEGQQDELRKRNWASIECDLLDNYHTRKRFASNDIANDLSRLQVLSTGMVTTPPSAPVTPRSASPSSPPGQPRAATGGEDAFCTPAVQRRTLGLSLGLGTSLVSPNSLAPPCADMERLDLVRALRCENRLPISPSDAPIHSTDLHKATLLKMLHRSGGLRGRAISFGPALSPRSIPPGRVAASCSESTDMVL